MNWQNLNMNWRQCHALTVEIRLINDAGEDVAFYVSDPFKPFTFRLPPDKPIIEDVTLDGRKVAEYSLYGYSFQPHVKLQSKETY